MICNSCDRDLPDSAYFTEVNPPNGYGRAQFLICDDCLLSNQWADWRARKGASAAPSLRTFLQEHRP